MLALPASKWRIRCCNWAAGSGRDIDKFAAFGLHGASAEHGGGLLLDAAPPAGMQSFAQNQPWPNATICFLAEVLAAWADDQAWCDGRWTFADPALRTPLCGRRAVLSLAIAW